MYLSPLLLVVGLWSLVVAYQVGFRRAHTSGNDRNGALQRWDGMTGRVLLGAQLLQVLCFSARNHTFHPCALTIVISCPHWHIRALTNLIGSSQPYVSSLIRLEEVYIPSTVITVEVDMHLCRMRLINVEAFLEREQLIRQGKRVDRRAKVLEFGDDEVMEYAILSHRWIQQEVDYNEVVKLAKMTEEERTEVRQRDGYRKILQSCEQSKKDGYKWLWVDTCCIDKGSSAELSGAINSMYRWYENSRIMRTSMTSPAHPFPLRVTMRSMPSRTAGRSGSHVGGHYKK